VTKSANTFVRRTLLPIAFTGLLVVAGCGVKGPLELPEGTQVSGNDGKGGFTSAKQAELPGYIPQQKEIREKRQLGNPIKRDEPFVLDPLLN
jgi:predicted small lipoprotein YifL